MEAITPFSQTNQNYNPQPQGAKQAPVVSMPNAKADSVEISHKKQKDYTGIIAVLATTTAAATAGVYGGKAIYNKYFQKLACGIKKGEIDDALYNFIKNNDPKGELFNNKDKVLELNIGLTDEKLLILKQLAKMKEIIPFSKETSSKYRFNIDDIKTLLSDINEGNIKHLEQLAQKTEKKEYSEACQTYTPQEIKRILGTINPQNDTVAKQLIDIAEINPESINKLIECFHQINNENINYWQIILSTRKKGAKTDLKLDDLPQLISKLEKTKNPKCAEILLNAEKKNGSGAYIYEIDDIIANLSILKEENAELYQKFYNLKAATDIETSNFQYIIPNLNENNIDLIETILGKKVKSSYSSVDRVIFDDWDKIKEILKGINSENKSVIDTLIKKIQNNNTYQILPYTGSKTYGECYKKPSEIITKLLNDFNDNPEKLQRAKEIINKEGTSMTFDKFVEKYFRAN